MRARAWVWLLAGWGCATDPPQAPIGYTPGDPGLSIRFRAPGAALEDVQSV